MRKIGIIGAGAAGLMAASWAALYGAEVTLFEKNDRPGKKLRITGKGRCNVTNACDVPEFMKNVVANPKFLYAALSGFTPEDTVKFFEERGVPLKVERGRRVFPVSDKADDIVRALWSSALELGCVIRTEKVKEILREDGRVTGLRTGRGDYSFDAVILCTGGNSYQSTGSDGDGYRFARSLGIRVTPLIPSLVPMVTEEDTAPLMGLSLKNVSLKVKHRESGKTVFMEQGEMLFTHFGVSGPMVLSASAHIHDIIPGRYGIAVDLKPALSEAELDRRILSDFEKYKNKDFINALGDLLPQKLIPYIVARSGIPERGKVNEITKEQRHGLVALMKGLTFTLKGLRPIDEAIVTSGGIAVSEVNPSTMESKTVKDLYFAGEVLDVDAYTGGYNLQIAFSTGVLAAQHAAMEEYD
ncbi:MAG: NAD(P)/FAD-dependent oxidoreductase [Clostridia bacterium]|nr:NAD(P)/FAD-dependent oxidoreductase [Clostridia bacterium]